MEGGWGGEMRRTGGPLGGGGVIGGGLGMKAKQIKREKIGRFIIKIIE